MGGGLVRAYTSSHINNYVRREKKAVSTNEQSLTDFYRGKSIMITGGTGSIGQHITAELLQHHPKQIVVFNKDDTKQYLMQQAYKNVPNVRFMLGDIRDYEAVHDAMAGIDLVFHTAALKQVPVCESNPLEAVKTNIIGSENVIRASIGNRVSKVINISTDKAVNPWNTLGACKLISEKLFRHGNSLSEHTRFCSVRFGNVINSRGSVIPIFMEQARTGKPLTLMEKGMSRFFITIAEAVERIQKALYYSFGGETFVLKMKALSIDELAETIRDLYKERGKSVEITMIGARSSEKHYEELIFEEEQRHLYEDEELFAVLPPHIPKPYHHFQQSVVTSYRSDRASTISHSEIRKILENLYPE